MDEQQKYAQSTPKKSEPLRQEDIVHNFVTKFLSKEFSDKTTPTGTNPATEDVADFITRMRPRAIELTEVFGLPREKWYIVMAALVEARSSYYEAQELVDEANDIESLHGDSTVTVGSIVTLWSVDQEQRVYRLEYFDKELDELTQVDFLSPLGQTLMGHRIGDRIQIPDQDRVGATKEFIIVGIA